MESNQKQEEVIAKMQCIFDTFLKEDFTTDNVYFEKLIKHLAEKENAYILQAKFAVEWVDKCVAIISEDISKVNPRVVSFMLNFCALLLLNQWVLIEIKERHLLDRVLTIVHRDHEKFNPSIKLGLIKLLVVISKHSMGLVYIRTSKAWRFLIQYCNQDHTIYVVREARKLLYELLIKYALKMNDEQTVLEIMNEVVQPILENVYDATAEKITIVVEDTELQHKLSSTLDLLSYIFQQTLECEEKTNFSKLCFEKYNIEINIWKLIEMTKNPPFMEKILTTLTSLNFCRLIDDQWTGEGQIASENFSRFGIAFFNMMKVCVSRCDCANFLKLAEIFHILWKKLGKRAPNEILVENERVRFENQLIVLHLMPLLFLLKSKRFEKFEIFDTYLMKIFEISCEHTLRICYSFRDMIINNRLKHLVPALACKSMHGMLSLEHILERDQAVLVFQAMTYALQEFIFNSFQKQEDACLKAEPTDSMGTELIVEIPNVLYAALFGLQQLIQRYRITWTESLETICVVNFVLHLLGNSNMTSRLAVQALKLLQLAIEHYLSPNMALLVNTLHGSGLIGIAPALAKRFHDPAWEVRDSALELTTSIANISRLKFPPFQQYLAEHKIAPIVYEMSKHDSEPYVRASALKCLSKMVAINVIWENELSRVDLIEHLFWVLYNESEGVVRKEAVVTLCKIYELRKVPNQYTDTLYSTLTHCVVVDLHWEVKVAALHFWELEIQNQFTHQGMIDGTFPTVTFSKEHKKIVTLTAKEINLRIVKVLNGLSQRGCLGIILKCLNEDCDLEVVKVAVCIVRRLLEKLQKYDYESLLLDKTNPNQIQLPVNDVVVSNSTTTMTLKMETCDDSDEPIEAEATAAADAVIERILDEQDINYLIAACESQLQLNKPAEKLIVDGNLFKEFTHVTPQSFITTIKSIDMEQLLQKQEWLLCAESLDALLDDILINIAPNEEKIFADCY